MRAPQLFLDFSEALGPDPSRGDSLERRDERRQRNLRRVSDEEMSVIVLEADLSQLAFEVLADGLPRRLEDLENLLGQDASTVLGHEDQMRCQSENHVTSRTKLV